MNSNYKALGLIAVSFVATAFGNSLQPISILAWIQPAALLLAYDCLYLRSATALKPLAQLLAVAFLHAAAFAIAFNGALSVDGFHITGLKQ